MRIPALTCGALCALRSRPDPPRRMVQTDSGQQEIQPAANELLPQTRRYEAQVEYRFGCENWAFFVDSFWPEEQKITELAGCHWHGCVRCKKYRNDEQINRYQRTMERARFIEARTDMDVEMEWECEIDNNPIFDNRQPNMYRYYCWKKAKDRKATTINPKLLLKMRRRFFSACWKSRLKCLPT